jgi:hypothetical protein
MTEKTNEGLKKRHEDDCIEKQQLKTSLTTLHSSLGSRLEKAVFIIIVKILKAQIFSSRLINYS